MPLSRRLVSKPNEEHNADAQSGIMEEMMEETLDAVDDEGIEEEADAEVDKVLFELTDGKLGQAGKVGAELPVRSNPLCGSWLTRQKEEEEESEAEIQRMQREMQDLLTS